ncbi:saccharopine dehydrogenase family protein [Brevibacillus laterosporus]|uniref:Saccharopine dehydrogenase NADP-binding domain-containing protein n=1 Tax=Brevibacillus laterosporus TaxID=1465 RepID=A0AAP3G7P9_BRELA|nr:saccharopine dehydrogenase NADP-binding domain-containing protein [Brevibacillus laterosporus]MCR8979411.1 saccharopine dehydrogenase NADP-binding domain-containing protein [Brevibacillus laterosporus]MCZ0806566.1 saccharopine dehydrogenase NADP-binding domain-containing protein [Brevibacillus laterosporus]MCZ0825014.1 saccharopine dehydrogenase NADP-binding domain-containing protein [Brevibacillus laterosporus]MCZ0849877.1 saccharopine dehydrogenase NADP-binding domain-containing protein [B
MDKKTIGILGASGIVGREAVQTILAFTNHHVVLGGRNPDNLCESFKEMEARIECLQVDVYNVEQLHRFCSPCDIVINCAGPSKQIVDTVASACIEHAVHYVDVSGDEHLYRQLLKRQHEIKEKGLLFLISAGVYPGLSEIFPAYIAENELEEIDFLELFFAGQGDFSLNAAYDIVCSIEEDTGLGMTYCKQGEAKKIDGSFHRNYELPLPAGKRDTYPVLTQEFSQMAKQKKISSAYFYNSYQNNSVLNQFVMIKALQQYKTEEEKKASAKLLVEQFSAKKQGVEDFTMFHLIATGNRNGKKMRLVSTLLYRGDWNRLSGIIAGTVARLIAEDRSKESGCFFVSEGVSATRLIGALREQTIDLTHSLIEIK